VSGNADLRRPFATSHTIGHELYRLVERLFPICRSITGDGVRQTLAMLAEYCALAIHQVPSGAKVFDWTIPKEWNIRSGFIENTQGNKIVDFRWNNLHVVSYSTPVDSWISLSELQQHLHSLADQPDAIPYVTSYYNDYWGFCISHHERQKLPEDTYHVYIDSDLKDGFLTYGECVIPGELDAEIFLSTYVCHPSMANNELSGPSVVALIARWLASERRRFTYRIVFVPETIGSITYLSRHVKHLKEKVLAAFNVSCVGDDRAYSYVTSRYGNTFADKVALNVLSLSDCSFTKYSFLDRGSDERQYCSPGVDLPMVTLSRSKYGTYPEYHTSLDNLDLVSWEGLAGGYELVKNCIEVIERNRTYKVKCKGEPQLGKRGLYPPISEKKSYDCVKTMMDFIAYCDGTNDLIDISNIIGRPVRELMPLAQQLAAKEVIEPID
jgi:aminopeptidase-like protein